mmetsp:Transcript_86942/g.246509  ORF Transcript_86942/g.246509 Transcript_86942/m.246509 type:complete len:85 (-) Transcript_86942:54-308(-)
MARFFKPGALEKDIPEVASNKPTINIRFQARGWGGRFGPSPEPSEHESEDAPRLSSGEEPRFLSAAAAAIAGVGFVVVRTNGVS